MGRWLERHATRQLDAAIIFAPVGALVPAAQGDSTGGVVVCAGIHMSDIPSFPYDLLWRERSVRSVANLTRRDGDNFMERAAHRCASLRQRIRSTGQTKR
jgi:propanol-preferring alcohol dehydrogenase